MKAGRFESWWAEEEKSPDISPEPWETFKVALVGQEAGDIMEDWASVRWAMSQAGLKIVDAETGEEVWNEVDDEEAISGTGGVRCDCSDIFGPCACSLVEPASPFAYKTRTLKDA